ncbi:RrF2 family transcriptional regulator [Chitinophaga sancti]|uniref:Rrf2 family transcriptional regulator n=1 Tax=Chitinophaga sancti TaxID=1004 RepID=A0A1K1SIG5_9BACT|nr:Rrf2 family transcriptional regulator [Chitinophaga sancti]WQD61816.1 Rrf2 family transcriptional regulator [Chitinophaga sancti]WQG92615.1 Rrf2 family transcriptional regulator [Chitinophaga sancti]SFW83855.1 transcriptional regulator, BadM/Rrf2 family [Chitinophaga sancti]
MFSKTCEYGIRAMIYIAQQSKNNVKVGVRDIAAGINSPEYFIAKILQELTRKGLLLSFKGPTGGFYLDDKALQCSIADIVRAIDGDKIFSGCGLGLDYCSEIKPCPIHHEFKKIRGDISDMLNNTKLDEFHEKIAKDIGFLKR